MACMLTSSAAPAHHPAALGESLLGGSTFLFLLKSPDHLLCSQALNGVTRPIPQPGFPISKRNWSFSVPFLVYWDQLHWLQCEGACAAQSSLILPDPGTPEGAGVQELSQGLPWNTLGLWASVWVPWFVVAFSALPSALLEICQSERGFCLRCFLQVVTHACALFLPHKWVVYVLGGNDS